MRLSVPRGVFHVGGGRFWGDKNGANEETLTLDLFLGKEAL